MHADAIAARLPELYRDGELLRGVIGAPALQVEIFDELMLEVQRAHWFDTTLELDEAARLAAILDLAPEPWQDLALFRGWVHSLRDAILEFGAVTRSALETFVVEYSSRYSAARGILATPAVSSFADAPSAAQAAFVENPIRRVLDQAAAPGSPGVEPLQQFSFRNHGLDPTEAAFLLVGLPAAPECAPVIVNVTSGQALLYLGTIGVGQRLAIRPDGTGGVQALLEHQDVTAALRSLTGVVPGTPWTAAQIDATPRALRLERGTNALWFLPVAHLDVEGLDRFLLALPDLTRAEGHWDSGTFDSAVFYQQPAVLLRALWRETRPAAFEIRLPAGTLLSRAGELDQALEARAQLGQSLDEGVDKLRAAGVSSRVVMQPFVEAQPSSERLAAVLPMRVRERGPTGADALPEAGGVYEMTKFDDSTYR
jgi:hypothetical protein